MIRLFPAALAVVELALPARAESSNNFLAGIRSINVTMTRD
jgi:hypothetical protein